MLARHEKQINQPVELLGNFEEHWGCFAKKDMTLVGGKKEN